VSVHQVRRVAGDALGCRVADLMGRAKVLGGQLADWRRAEMLRAYLEAMRRAIGTMEPAAADTAGEWLAWARAMLPTSIRSAGGSPCRRIRRRRPRR